MKDFFRHPVIGIDRILSSGIKWQLLFLLGVIVAAILLFIVIEWLTGSILTIKENDPRNIFVDVYYHFADPGNQYVVEGTWNRFLAFLISITGSALMGGLLISIFSNIIDRRVERAREGQIGYKFRNHYVIIGFDKMAIGLIKQLYQKSVAEQSDHTPYLFVIQTSGSVDSARHELLSKLDASIDRRTIILHGGRDSREDLEKLHLPDCKEIFLLGEENETDHDSINIECAALINRILREKNAIGKEPRDQYKNWAFVLAFTSIGLETNFREIKEQFQGGKPLTLYVVGQLFNIVLTFAAVYLLLSGKFFPLPNLAL